MSDGANTVTRAATAGLPRPGPLAALGAALGVGLLWAWWPALEAMSRRWSGDPRYSHGYLVPAFAAFLLWSRRGRLAGAPPRPSWWGPALVAAGAALGLCGTYFYVNWFQMIAPLPMLAGIALALGGWRALAWSWPAIAFLLFMVPLPYRAEVAIGAPLQRIGTLASTYALQTLGLPAVAEGNVILLDADVRIGVVEACNGLGMLVMFFAYTTAAALVIRRPLADRLFIVLSAVPIALMANISRITVTGLLHELMGKRWADAVYHDLAGWLMMPLALAVLWAELALLSRLFVEVEAAPAALPLGGRGGPAGLHPLDLAGLGRRPGRPA